MDAHKHHLNSSLELYLLDEAGFALSNLLGIRIYFQKASPDKFDKAVQLCQGGWRFSSQWQDFEGRLDVFFSKHVIAELLAIEIQNQNDETYTRLIRHYANQCIKNFSLRLSSLFSKSWDNFSLRIDNISDGILVNDPSSSTGVYDIFIGSQFLSHFIIVTENPLDQLWNDQWKKSSTPKLKIITSDFDQSAPVSEPCRVSNTSQLPNSLEVEFPVSAELSKIQIKFKHLLELGPGDIIHLDKIESDSVDLFISNQKFAEGRIVKANGKLGIQITALVGTEERMCQLIHSGQFIR